MSIISSRNSQWMKAILVIAGVYHILWGSSVVAFPEFWFNIASLPVPNYIQIWQAYGMIFAVFGLGFFVAALNPLRHWPIVLMGFLIKVFAPIGFFYYFMKGELPMVVLNMHFTNELIWWIPFGLILYNAYKHEYLLDNEIIHFTEHDTEELLSWYSTNKHVALIDLSNQQPVMLVFLRHFGCVFCRITLTDIARYRDSIEKMGTRIVLVHQLKENEAEVELSKYGIKNIDHISDPELILYKGFHLKRGTILQLFGVKEWSQYIQKGIIKGLGIGAPGEQDPFQMPGVFLIHKGKIKKQFIHKTASEIPPYMELAKLQDAEEVANY